MVAGTRSLAMADKMPAIRIGRWVMCRGGFSRRLKWREYIKCKLGREVLVSYPNPEVKLPLWKVNIGYTSGITGWTWREAATAEEAIEMVKAGPNPSILSISAILEDV